MKRISFVIAIFAIVFTVGLSLRHWRRHTLLLTSEELRVGQLNRTSYSLDTLSVDEPNLEEMDIFETIFRYRMVDRDANMPIFLSVEGRDPSDSFMARFAKSNLVKKESASYFDKSKFPGWLRDRKTQKKGVLLSVHGVKWFSSNRVEVKGGSYCGGLCADAGTYKMIKRSGRWIVEEYVMEMIS